MPSVSIERWSAAALGGVRRRGFVPVKTTNDLLVLRSDAYVLDEDARLDHAPGRTRAPLVDLDPAVYRLVRDFDARFPAGAPSLRACDRLTVRGDVTFGAGVVVRGDVTVEGPRRLDDGAILDPG